MQKIAGFALLLAATAAFAHAGPVAPEIDSGTAASALAALAGAALIIRGRKKHPEE